MQAYKMRINEDRKQISFDLNLIKVSKILDIDYFNGAIRVGDLIDIMEIAEFNPWESPLRGYQRKINPQKVTAIAERTLDNLDSPEALVDAINLNIRTKAASKYLQPIEKNKEGYGCFYRLPYIEALGKAYIVDGQHRAKGLQAAASRLNDDKKYKDREKLLNTYVNISLTLTDDIFKEAYTFYLINQYAKNVSPEGATRLMLEGYQNNQIEFINEVTRGSTKVTVDDIASAKIADKLAEDSDVWASRIKDYNEKGAGKVSIRAMSLMIRPVYLKVKEALDISGSSIDPIDATYELVEVFWSAIKKVFPDMFSLVKGSDYGITKSSQAEVMMKVLQYIYVQHNDEWEKNDYKFGNIKNQKDWVKVLSTLTSFKDKNNQDNPKEVTGAANWKVGKAGSMGKYTSAGGKIAIAKNLCKHIEYKLNIERRNPDTLIS